MDRKADQNQKLIEEELKSVLLSTYPKTTTTAPIKTTATSDPHNSSDSLDSWTVISDSDNKKSDDGNENHIEILRDTDTEKENKEDVDKDIEEDSNDDMEEDSDDDMEEDSDHDMVDGIDDCNKDLKIPNLSMKVNCDDLSNSISSINKSKFPHEPSQIRQLYQNSARLRNYVPLNRNARCNNCSSLQFLVKRFKDTVKIALFMAFVFALFATVVDRYYFKEYSTVIKSNKAINSLQERVTKMELENNLMRAEIDLINKQMNYLSKLNEQQKSEKHKEEKTFKAWPGNGDSLIPIDITKEDLKKPFKCPDGSLVEIANMCLEHIKPSIIDQFDQVVENINDEFASFNENENKMKYNSREWKKDKYGESSEMHSNGYNKDKRNKYIDIDFDESHARYRESNKKQHKYKADSGESRSDYIKQKERKQKRNIYNDDSDEWHNNYMQNREKQRERADKEKKLYKNVKFS